MVIFLITSIYKQRPYRTDLTEKLDIQILLLYYTTMAMMGDYITVREACRRLGVHEETIRRLVRSGSLKADKIGNQWFIRREELGFFSATYNPKTGKRKRLI
jgi:excisionase family DNA binding protein